MRSTETSAGNTARVGAVPLWLSCLSTEESTDISLRGDSRIYRCNRKGARPITRDDVWENRPGADAGSDNAGKIISALGAYERLEYSCATDKVHMGEVFLLCSDGIYRFVEEDTLKSVLQRMYRSLFLTKGAVERLVKTAVDNDTKDNYSLIAVKI